MKPGWHWAGIGIVIFFAALAVSAWNEQRLTRQMETVKPGLGTAPSSEARAPVVKPPLAAAKSERGVDSDRSPRDRPDRNRSSRP